MPSLDTNLPFIYKKPHVTMHISSVVPIQMPFAHFEITKLIYQRCLKQAKEIKDNFISVCHFFEHHTPCTKKTVYKMNNKRKFDQNMKHVSYFSGELQIITFLIMIMVFFIINVDKNIGFRC